MSPGSLPIKQVSVFYLYNILEYVWADLFLFSV